jgi:iron complex outermembrane receptor protein
MKHKLPPFQLRKSIKSLSHALTLIAIVTPAFAQSQSQVQLKPVEITASAPVTLDATETAPSQGSLDARSAVSIVSDKAVRDYMTPLGDYTQAISMTPGAFSYTANGVGLGDAKVTVRGLSDSNMVIGFDGIPFNDTNGVSHHSWVFFPNEFLGGAVIDRSPGSAATIGQATYGGNIDLRSRILETEESTSVIGSLGSWNTNLIGLEHQTGQFGTEGKSSLMFNVQNMHSDGYQTYNKQDRQALSGKYQYVANSDTVYTLFGSALELKNNTPATKGISRTNYLAGNYVDMLSADPKLDSYYGYNFYDVTTNFEYAGVKTKFEGGWNLDDKLYHYEYHNKQNYANNTTPISTTLPSLPNLKVEGTDKLNSYVTNGNVLRLSKENATGILRTGIWLEQSSSYRYQIPTNPVTWVDVPLPNFLENYLTTTTQPYVEYEFKVSEDLRVTPGIKYAQYTQDFVHAQDNFVPTASKPTGGVGLLGGTAGPIVNKVVTSAVGGASTVSNSITYTDWLPSLDVHYKIQPNWSVYGQYSVGDQIPSTSVFDVPNAKVTPPPLATKSTGMQVGTVWSSPAYTFSADIYSIKLDNSYTAGTADASGNVPYSASGTEVSQGIEAESNIALGSGFSLYLSGTIGSVKYADGPTNGQWVAGAPQDTETIGLTYQRGEWDVAITANRVGQMYADDKSGTVHEVFTIDPVVLTNLFVNYTVKTPFQHTKKAKVQVGVNNVFDNHAITAIAPVTGSTGANPAGLDLLSVLPGRSINVTLTLDF